MKRYNASEKSTNIFGYNLDEVNSKEDMHKSTFISENKNKHWLLNICPISWPLISEIILRGDIVGS